MAQRIVRICISSTLSSFPYLVKPPILLSIVSTRLISSCEPEQSKTLIRVSDYLINDHRFSTEATLSVSSRVAYVKYPERASAVLAFLKEIGFSNPQIENVLRIMPNILSSNLDKTIKPKITLLQDWGFSPDDIAQIISSYPTILRRNVDNHLIPWFSALNRVLGSQASVCKMLKRHAWIADTSPERTMLPNTEFLKGGGISLAQITKYMFLHPRLFMIQPDNFKCIVKRVDEMGIDRTSKMFMYVLRCVSSVSIETWEHKVQLLQSLGFSVDDIQYMCKQHPNVFTVSEEKFKKVSQLLLSAGYDISHMVKYPIYFSYSLERRLHPRLKVLEILQTKKLIKRNPSLRTLFSCTEKVFLDRYVIPYSSELGELTSVWSDDMIQYENS